MQPRRLGGRGRRTASQVVTLYPQLRVQFDPEPLARLRSRLGPRDAADSVRRAREELIHILNEAEGHHRDCDFVALANGARRLMSLACEIGLPDLRRASEHVMRCARGRDETALAATLSRLLRLGTLAADQIGDLATEIA